MEQNDSKYTNQKQERICTYAYEIPKKSAVAIYMYLGIIYTLVDW